MQWLPAITIHGQKLSLPISHSDFLWLLRAMTDSDMGERRASWIRLLLQSPTMLTWSLHRHAGAADFSTLTDASIAGASISNETILPQPAPEFIRSKEWSTDLSEYLDTLIEKIADPALQTTLAVGSSARSAANRSLIHGSAGQVISPTREINVAFKADLLDRVERIVQPFWSSEIPDCRGWLDELFGSFQFKISPRDRPTAYPLLSPSDIRGAIDSWAHHLPQDLGCILPAVVDRLQTADRLGRDFENEKLASLKQLAYGASHEINNPLANIATRAQLLLASEKDEARRKHLATIYQQAMRAHEMITDMMLFAHPPAPMLQSVEMVELLRKACREFGPLVELAGWTIECSSDLEAIYVQADPSQIISLLQAIVQNSVESRSSGHVLIACRNQQATQCAVEIRDNGPGISEQALRHMFDPFYSGREAGRGLGFGLSKAWTIARMHGGKICVKSTGPEGTTMLVEFPAG